MPYTITAADRLAWDAELAKDAETGSQAAAQAQAPSTPAEGAMEDGSNSSWVQRALGKVGNIEEGIAKVGHDIGQGAYQSAIYNPIEAVGEALRSHSPEQSFLGKTGKFIENILPAPSGDNNWLTTLGGILGFAAPMTGATKLLGVMSDLGKASRMGQAVRAALATGAASGISANPGERGEDAALGGATGGALEGMGQVGQKLSHWLLKRGALDRYKQLLPQTSTFEYTPKTPPEESLVNDIGQAYTEAQNATAPLYKQIFSKVRKKWGEMRLGDFRTLLTYRRRANELVPKKVQEMLDDFALDPYRSFDAEDVHYLQSDLRGQPSVAAKNYGAIISNDVRKYLAQNRELKNYNAANKLYQRNLLPYKESPLFRGSLKSAIDSASGRDEATRMMQFRPENLQKANYKAIVDKLLPTQAREGMTKLNQLTALLGGDKKLAGFHAARNILNRGTTIDADTNETLFDLHKFLNTYRGLSTQQRNFMFPKNVQDQLQGFLKVSPRTEREFHGPKDVDRATALGTSALVLHEPHFAVLLYLYGLLKRGYWAGRDKLAAMRAGQVNLDQLSNKIFNNPVRPSMGGVPSRLGTAVLTQSLRNQPFIGGGNNGSS